MLMEKEIIYLKLGKASNRLYKIKINESSINMRKSVQQIRKFKLKPQQISLYTC
jgi:hypothetical protein